MRLNFNDLLFSFLMHSLFLLAIIFSFSFFSPIANASLLEENQNMRTISFTLRDNYKPMIEAVVAGKKGVLMFDIGTPDLMFLNRYPLNLPAGKYVTKGFTSSGQLIEVQNHLTPLITINNLRINLPDHIRSGDFRFTESGLGFDFLGFIGAKMIEKDAFLLDYSTKRLLIMKLDSKGELLTNAPQDSEIMAIVNFSLSKNGLPMITASIGDLPIITDFDTGDSGTLYASQYLLKKLSEQGSLKQEDKLWRLSGINISGKSFNSILVKVVEARSDQDFRSIEYPDQLRLGSSFFSTNPSLWNYSKKSVYFIHPHAKFLTIYPH